MAKTPKFFQTAPDGAIASYDWEDLITGVGINRYYGYSTKSSAALVYHLSSTPVRSAEGNITNEFNPETQSGACGANATYHLVTQWDFDLPAFALPQTLRGTANINVTYGAFETDASSAFGYLRLNVIHFDGTTETIIGTTDTRIVDAANSTHPELTTGSVEIDVTEKHFKIGDVLRLNVEAWMAHTGGGSNTFLHFGHSPTNIDTYKFTSATNPTRLDFYVPFKITK